MLTRRRRHSDRRGVVDLEHLPRLFVNTDRLIAQVALEILDSLGDDRDEP